MASDCPVCMAEIQEAHRQIAGNPTALKAVDKLMSEHAELPLGQAIVLARDSYFEFLFTKLREMKAEQGSVPQWLTYHLALGMTEKQQKRLEAL